MIFIKGRTSALIHADGTGLRVPIMRQGLGEVASPVQSRLAKVQEQPGRELLGLPVFDACSLARVTAKRSARVGGRWRGCGRVPFHGAAVPGVLGELAELALCEEVDLDVVDGDARVALALGVFKGPEFFAVFVGDGDGFAFSGDEAAGDVRGFDQDGEAFGGGWLCWGARVSFLADRTMAGGCSQTWVGRNGTLMWPDLVA